MNSVKPYNLSLKYQRFTPLQIYRNVNDSISLYDLGVRNLHRSHGWDWIHAPGRSLKQFRNFESFLSL